MSELEEVMERPWRLGIIGVGVALGLIGRLLAANGVGDIDSNGTILAATLSCLLIGAGLVSTASQRDSFGPSLWWLGGSTAIAYAAVMWISPPFTDDTASWDNGQQALLAFLGLGTGIVTAGIVVLALVRRLPTLTIAATLIAGVLVLAANTLFLRSEWTGIVLLAASFALVLVAWDRTPRREERFDPPTTPPRTSRAALSLAVVALAGTGLQLWLSRDTVPRAAPAIVVCCALIVGAFWTMYHLRRELQKREAPLSEWRGWMHEIRTNDFQEELEAFAPGAGRLSFDLPHHPELDTKHTPAEAVVVPDDASSLVALDDDDPSLPVGPDDFAAQITRAGRSPATPISPISPTQLDVFSSLSQPAQEAVSPATDPDGERLPEIPRVDVAAPGAGTSQAPDIPRVGDATDADSVAPQIRPDSDIDFGTEPLPAVTERAAAPGAFSAKVAGDEPAAPAVPPPTTPARGGVAELRAMLSDGELFGATEWMFVAVEAQHLDDYDRIDPAKRSDFHDAVAAVLQVAEPTAELVAWIDGPYFVIAYRSMARDQLMPLNKRLQSVLHQTVAGNFVLEGTLAMLRPEPGIGLDQLLDEAVEGLLQARRIAALSRLTGH